MIIIKSSDNSILTNVKNNQDVPAQNSVDNSKMRDVIGNKTDTIGGDSLISLTKIIDNNVDDIETIVTNTKTKGNLNYLDADRYLCGHRRG